MIDVTNFNYEQMAIFIEDGRLPEGYSIDKLNFDFSVIKKEDPIAVIDDKKKTIEFVVSDEKLASLLRKNKIL